jgi:hypothetical protein
LSKTYQKHFHQKQDNCQGRISTPLAFSVAHSIRIQTDGAVLQGYGTCQNDFQSRQGGEVQRAQSVHAHKENAIATFQAPPWCPSLAAIFFRLMMTGDAFFCVLISPPFTHPTPGVAGEMLPGA